jgi:hypothetical protein
MFMRTMRSRLKKAPGFVVGLVFYLSTAWVAYAHRSPIDCNANRLTLSTEQTPTGNVQR